MTEETATAEATEEATETATEENQETAESTKEVSNDTHTANAEDPSDWRDSIQDADLRKHADRFTSVEALTKANLDYRKKESKSVTRLSEDSSEEELGKYREAVGVPVDVDGYDFPLPEGVEETEEILDREDVWANLFLNHNVPKEAADAIVQQYYTDIGELQERGAEADAKYTEDAKNNLKAEWKDDYDKNMIYASRASEKLLGEDYEAARFIEDKQGNYVLDNPILAKMFATLGRQMGEGNLGGVVTDGERETLMQKANDFRQKAKDAHASGNTSDANKYAAKELEVLTVLNGSEPVVGVDGRQF